MLSNSSGFDRSREARFTETRSGGSPLSIQVRACRQVSASTQVSRATMTSVRSAMEMNDEGSRTPREGWFHRISASTPTTSEVRRSM